MTSPNTNSKPKESAWDKTKHGGKAAFDKGWAMFEKLGAPVNKLTNKIGSEAFWPTTLDHESDKSARILKSFCKDGFYKDEPARPGSSSGPKNKPKVLVKIPQKVIQNCVGLAVFTVMRTGLWVSGAGGSGVLIAKKPDGSWSPPAGILIHTLGVGFMAGIDIYDCVLVINSREALTAFSKVRVSLGGEISVVAGPLGIGGNLESELTKDRKPVFSYMKSRGLYGGIQLDGTIIVERNDENARFYGERLPLKEILAGNVRNVPVETRMLNEVLKEAEGRKDLDYTVLETVHHQPAPGDIAIEDMSKPTAEQQAAFAPPYGYYAPENSGHYGQDLKIDPEAANHPVHPGPPSPYAGTGPYYPPPPPQQSHNAYGGQTPYFPPPPGSAGQENPAEKAQAHGALQQNYHGSTPSVNVQGPTSSSNQHEQYYPPPPPGPPPSSNKQEQYYPPPPPGPPPHQ